MKFDIFLKIVQIYRGKNYNKTFNRRTKTYSSIFCLKIAELLEVEEKYFFKKMRTKICEHILLTLALIRTEPSPSYQTISRTTIAYFFFALACIAI